MSFKSVWCIAFFALIIACSPKEDLFVTKISDTAVDPFALTINGEYGQAINGKSFQQDVLLTHNNFQYLAYYDSSRHVCVARRKLPTGNWNTIRFLDYHFKSNDAHNTISMGICPNDGTIHLAFDHHVHPLHYQVSQQGVATNPDKVKWETKLFGPVLSELEKGKPIKITYPRFLQTPEGELQFCYRRRGSGNGDRMLVDYDSKTGNWVNTRQIDSSKGLFEDALGSSTSRCSYPNGYNYDKEGNLHTTWVWRESSQGANHDLVYVYSKDNGNTWLNNVGELITGPPNVHSSGIIAANIERTYGLMNTHGQAIDSKGRIHVLMWHCSDESLKSVGSHPGDERWGPLQARRYHHYWRALDGTWKHVELPWIAGSRPKIFMDKSDNLILIFGARDTDSTEHVTYTIDDLVIAMSTSESFYETSKILYVEKGPFVNEMLGDNFYWKKEGILSVLVQEMPDYKHQPTPLRVLDFSLGIESDD